jgi:membrane-associated HD superfamily phosphohydrolase
MNPIFFLLVLVIAIFVTFAYTIMTTQPKYSSAKHPVIIFTVISIMAVVIGKLTGDFSSHGFDIPTWGFSLIFFILCLNAYFFAKVSVWLMRRYMDRA